MRKKPAASVTEDAPDEEARIEYVSLDVLERAKRNPKNHDIPTIRASLLRHGFVAPLVENAKTGRLVAAECGVELREVAVPPPTAADLAQVVAAIEMPHKAQVEIGWACLVLAERMRSDGFKVTFSGEGSDELWASYGFAYHVLKTEGWFPYRKKLFLGQHRKNFARCNKIFMARSVECRLPFLSTGLVELALSLPERSVKDGSRSKAVLQDAFAGQLPERICQRQKLAFQDGLGLKAAVGKLVADPRAFYAESFRSAFAGVAP